MTDTSPGTPRLSRVSLDHPDAATQAAIEHVRPYGDPANAVVGVLLRNPRLAELYLPFADHLKHHGALPVRLRRLAILRTAWNCGAEYPWLAHIRYAQDDGMPGADIERVVRGADAPDWGPADRAVLRAVDELHTSCSITDPTWEALCEHLDDAQLVELVVLVGSYRIVATLTNAVGITPERDDTRVMKPTR